MLDIGRCTCLDMPRHFVIKHRYLYRVFSHALHRLDCSVIISLGIWKTYSCSLAGVRRRRSPLSIADSNSRRLLGRMAEAVRGVRGITRGGDLGAGRRQPQGRIQPHAMPIQPRWLISLAVIIFFCLSFNSSKVEERDYSGRGDNSYHAARS